ncbi:zinc ribbon domain-containing protein [Nonomuraea sp. NPDC049646]|uniref:zinc ribbon domain-containing protein n=1 Tax=unclassified Nonomuraea TaxID=2593643 RepID=UPI0037AAD28C
MVSAQQDLFGLRAANPRLTLADRVFTCGCGLTLNRDINAAQNIAGHAVAVPAPVAETVAPDRGRRKTPAELR